MTEEQKQRAERNKLIFERALFALAASADLPTRQDVIDWLNNDDSPDWQEMPKNEPRN